MTTLPAFEPCVIEWITTPDGVHLLDGAPRIGFGYWRPVYGPHAPGLAVEVRDEPSGQCYTVWLPESEALTVRNTLLRWWPVDRFPV